jgi:DNA-binding transcriptional MerR regulator
MQRSGVVLPVLVTLLAIWPMRLEAQGRSAASQPVTLERLQEGTRAHGFRARALYLDAAGAPMGARLVHERTGFVLDYLAIESVPQSFIWVSAFPTSDRGEPHTQEHLLLGKGNKGRSVANLENMTLTRSSAFVSGWRTAYHFHTAAGPDVYHRVLEAQLDALLHPDYTDEEIRREVRNFGVAQDADGTLRLEEKGTVYNEMVSSFERPASRGYRALYQMMYGTDHPMSWSAGGYPAAIREMEPEHIREFHADAYQLGNMGMVSALPRAMPLDGALRSLDGILLRVQGDRPVRRDFMTEETLPVRQAAPAGEIRRVEYPHQNPQQPSPLYFAWSPDRLIEPQERLLLDLFVQNLAGDPTTNLYRIFVDGRTREIDVGARGVWGWVSGDRGHPIYMGLNDVNPRELNEERIAEIRTRIVREIERLAALPAGDPELREFNERIRSRVVSMRRQLSRTVETPPAFGERGTGTFWVNHLHDLQRLQGFRKPLALGPQLDEVERLLAGEGNPWSARVAGWGLAGQLPYAAATLPSSELVRRDEAERRARVQEELARLHRELGAADAQETIRRYAALYDAETERQEEIARGTQNYRFLDAPPMALDEGLNYRSDRVGMVPRVVSTFPGMSSSTVGLALRLDGVGERDLVYLTVLPTLLTEVGVIEDGVPISHGEMRERLRREILSLNAYFSVNAESGRAELVVRGAGNDPAETRRALHWMRLALLSPDWRPENLPRIRDVVDQSLAGLRNTSQRAEEAWVNDPAQAYRFQTQPLLLATASFLTRSHNAHRLRWMLMDPASEAEAAELDAFLQRLGGAAGEGSRADLSALLGALRDTAVSVQRVPARLQPVVREARRLTPGARGVVAEAARDLEAALADIPDASLRGDWAYLNRQMAADFRLPAAQALGEMDAVRRRVAVAPGGRLFQVGSAEGQAQAQPALEDFVGRLGGDAVARASYDDAPRIEARLRERVPDARSPVFVGLVNPNTQGGVFLNNAPLAAFADTDRERLLDFLSAKLYAGGGAHSIFMKTWAAGLAYSNGLRSSPRDGRLGYYAERVPELPQTLGFVIGELRRAEPDPAFTEYAVAQAFGELRGALPYESRAEAMAADLVDGRTPERVRAFREGVLRLRGEARLTEEIFGRMERVYGRVLPGYGPPSAQVEDGYFFIIGPENQFRLYEEYLRGAEGPQVRLHRLYPRDFWMVRGD